MHNVGFILDTERQALRELPDLHVIKGGVVEVLSGWRCGKAVKIASRGSSFVVDVCFDGGFMAKMNATDLRKAVAIEPPRLQRYSNLLYRITPRPRVGSSGSLRCLSKNCLYQVHSDAFFGSFCCRWCFDSTGIRHGKYCQRQFARAGAARANRTRLVEGGKLSEIWRRMAALSKCRPSVAFNSLNGALFRSMIFDYFVDPRYGIKLTTWPWAAGGPSAPTLMARTAVARHPFANGARATDLGQHHPCLEIDDESQSSTVVMENLSNDDPQPVACIPPEEAAQIAVTLWALAAERGIERGVHLNTTDVQADQLLLLKFGRHPKEFERALAESDLAQMLSDRGVFVKPDWANGAKILADGVTEEMVDTLSVKLSNKNVVVAQKDEHKVYDALKTLPYGQRPRLKPENGRQPLELDPEDVSLFADASDDDSLAQKTQDVSEPSGVECSEFGYEVEVKRTFIHFSESSSSGARTVSTSQFRQLTIGNPRSKVPR